MHRSKNGEESNFLQNPTVGNCALAATCPFKVLRTSAQKLQLRCCHADAGKIVQRFYAHAGNQASNAQKSVIAWKTIVKTMTMTLVHTAAWTQIATQMWMQRILRDFKFPIWCNVGFKFTNFSKNHYIDFLSF